MEILSFVRELVQGAVEHAASYRLGQTCIRYMDKVLWTVEKCARWAVPPPLDQDERQQPQLIRPLPWVFFLMLLILLRLTRESISLVNLAFGKPPFRSADMVSFIQSKRRYLRTLKYQGTRMMRARSEAPGDSWRSSLYGLFQFTMCFRRHHYANNNTTQASNNDEVLVVKRTKRGRQSASPMASTSETSMERLIEKMMVDLDADSDESSSYTLTNAASLKSDRSDYTESDQEFYKESNNSSALYTSTPERELSREEKRSDLETILNFVQSERNGQNHKFANGTYTLPAKERIAEGELIY
ncbi:uncharacterized protein LOC119832079 [Zerene cesonia]|uniref:uncharacterized protein LOC119832079 n=1 Tax=Zerene cesonia TaxID=33412 RepID=UPI0018E59CCD|nr:uncharacterized protein LOC119832079 [Zerene cesonia]XP_038211615.1 uncharacterized protein LOC119832079 [Zerene cesonia]XP_038211616.1 uncharacterized protein LOC119832079 [Zerene cesonia]